MAPRNEGFFFLSGMTPSQLFLAFLKPPKANHQPGTPPAEPKPDNRDSMKSAMSDLEAAKEKYSTEEPWKPTTKEWLILATLATSSLIVALDAVILVPVLPTLALDLHGSTTDAFWAGTSYLLAHSVLQPFIAALSDIFGRRELLFPSIFFFLIGSIVCAVAQSFATLLVGRVIQGIGGAGIITLAQVITADVVPLRQRPKYFSMVLLAWSIGTVLGPLLGGTFVQRSTWRWCFYLNIPICTIAMLMCLFFVKLQTEKSSLRSKLARVDWVGGFLFIAGLTSFLIAISWGGVQFAWGSVSTVVPLVLGVVGVLLALGWERYYAREAFLTKSLFHNLSAVAAYICALLQGLCLYLILYYLTLYFASAKLRGPIDSGADLLPAISFLLPGSVIVSQLITRLGTFRWAVWGGWSLGLIGAGMMTRFDANTSTAYWAVTLAIFGMGMGSVLTSVNFAVQATVHTEDAGRGAALYAFMRSVGMAIGVAIGGTVFQNLMQNRLDSLNVPNAKDIAHNAEAFIKTLHGLDATDPLRSAALDAYSKGSQGAFEVVTAVCALGLLLSLCIKHANMDKILESKHSSR